MFILLIMAKYSMRIILGRTIKMTNYHWDLTPLYPSMDSESFLNDFHQIETMMDQKKEFLSKPCDEIRVHQFLELENAFQDLISRIYSFLSLQISVDAKNKQAIKYASQLETLLASYADVDAQIETWLAQLNLSQLQDSYVEEHAFVLKENQLHQQYALSTESEKVLANMKVNGSSAWEQYKNQVIASHKVSVDGKEYPLTAVLNMAYSPDPEVRKHAYEAEVASYKTIEEAIAACLNAIKGESLQVSNLRGYDSVLQRTLQDSRLSQKTLDVLLETIRSALPMFQRFYRLKARTLGYEKGLPWYELYAPIVKTSASYPYEKGAAFVIEQFTSFSENLGNYAKTAIENHWIDVYPQEGKVGGAFCNNLHCIGQSRFLLNYGGEFSDVSTMAHELGHGFHGHCLKDQTALNAEYPMPIAETASTFCETIVKKAAMKHARKEEKIMILENELTDCAQVIVDIYSRYLFESRVIEKRKQGPLSVEEIKDEMIQAQKEAYGDGLDENILHPYMWTWKSHYYSADLAFYNFPYAFGLLLAKGLYACYEKDPIQFPKTYETFLSNTGKMNLEDVGKQVGIDLQDPSFWKGSIDRIQEDLDTLEALLEE